MKAILIGCCRPKKQGPLPAVELYDSPRFRTLRFYLNMVNQTEQPKILIYSAKYGLISGDTIIENYDLQLNKELMRSVKTLNGKERFLLHGVTSLFVSAGNEYKRFLDRLLDNCSVKEVQGKEGRLSVQYEELRRYILGDDVPVATETRGVIEILSNLLLDGGGTVEELFQQLAKVFPERAQYSQGMKVTIRRQVVALNRSGRLIIHKDTIPGRGVVYSGERGA